MKPQKRVRFEIGSPLFRPGKGTILTLDEARNKYVSEDSKLYDRAWIEALQSPVVEWLSADGLTLKELNRNSGILQCYQVNQLEWRDVLRKDSADIRYYRLKPQPEYIPVPECVELVAETSSTFSVIYNNKRSLFIGSDGLPIMGQTLLKPQPHQIDPTPVDEFEDGGICLFSYTNTNLKEDAKYTGNYGVFCAKENRMYFFDTMNGYALTSMLEPKLANFRKVIPVK